MLLGTPGRCASLLLPLLAAALAVPGARPRPSDAPERPQVLAVTHVTVIDMTGAPPRPDATVIVEVGRIVRVGPAPEVPIPEGARVLERRGRWLLPGLWDMHAHTGRPERDLGLFLANGVTGIRDMGGEAEGHPARPPSPLSATWKELRPVRDAVRAGREPGPRIVAAGVMLDGPEPWAGTLRVDGADEARRVVRMLRGEGVDFIKIGTGLRRDAYEAVAQETTRTGPVFAGHVPGGMTALEAAQAGQRSIEHLMGLPPDCFSGAHPGADCGTVLAHLAELRTWQTPTLVAWHNLLLRHEPAVRGRSELRYVRGLAEAWEKDTEAQLRTQPPAEREGARGRLEQLVRAAGALHRAGVRLLAGTDCGNPYTVPGFSLHEELRRLVAAGLTPAAALTAATIEPARYLGLDGEIGTIEAGRSADLLILEDDPLADVANTARIDSVIVKGDALDRGALDRMLRGAGRLPRRSRGREKNPQELSNPIVSLLDSGAGGLPF